MFLFTASSKIILRTYAEAPLQPMALATFGPHLRKPTNDCSVPTPRTFTFALMSVEYMPLYWVLSPIVAHNLNFFLLYCDFLLQIVVCCQIFLPTNAVD